MEKDPVNQQGFLTARYLEPSNDTFENSEVYRLKYERQGAGIKIEDALGESFTYETIAEFRREWDMDNIPERYKADNPDLEKKA